MLYIAKERMATMKNNILRNFIAIALIGMGTMLVLDNIGVIESDIKELWHYVYAIFFIVLGLTLMKKYFMRGGESWIFGSFLIIFGSLLLLGRLEIVQYRFTDIIKLWPLLIIYIGFSIFGKSNKRKKSHVHIFNNDDYDYQKNNGKRFVVGNFEYKQPNWKVKPMNLWSAAGDYYFDFSRAFIPDEEIPIKIDSWAGDVQMVLPESLEFRIDASVKAGEIDVDGQRTDGVNRSFSYESAGYETATQKLDIYIVLKAGSIRIDKV